MYGGNRSRDSRDRFSSGPRREGGFREGGFAPVRVGEELEVTIEAVGEKGDGIAKVKGFVLFVPGTKAGEKVMVRVNKVLRKVGFAEVIGNAKPKEESSEETEEGSEESSEETEEGSEESSKETEEPYEDSEEF